MVLGIEDRRIGATGEKIPTKPPVMLAPALLVTIARVPALMALPPGAVMLPELVTLAEPATARIP